MEDNYFLYAVLQDNIVVNVVVGENDQAGPILALMLEDFDVVRVTDETGMAIITGEYLDGVFRSPKPYQSWVWDSGSKNWTSPTERPAGPHFWDESSEAWLPIPLP